MSSLRPSFRRATHDDLPELVSLLAADPLGSLRERVSDPLPASYEAAFAAIDADPNQELTVACVDREVVGVLQLTFVPSLTYRGRWRAQIEGVRVATVARGRGVGRAMFEWAIGRARERDCGLVQLTTDRQRPAALAFYEALGFAPTHVGMKLHLTQRIPGGDPT